MFINNRNPESSLEKMALQQHFIFQRSTSAAEQTPEQQCQPVRAWAIVACSSAKLSLCPSAAPCLCNRVQDPHPKRQSYEDGHRDGIWVSWSPHSGTGTSSGSRTPRCKTSPGGGGAHPLAPFHPAPNPNQAIERSRGGLCSYPQLRNQSHALLNTSFT